MSIQLRTALNNASNFIDLAYIAKHAKEDISFFGSRFIYVEGYEGSVDIDALAAHFMALQKTHAEPDERERRIGKKITPLINKIYKSNDSRSINILSRIFCIVRTFLWNIYNTFFGRGYGTRTLFEIDRGGFFDSYTKSQYEKMFGETPKSFPSMRSGCPNRWYPPKII